MRKNILNKILIVFIIVVVVSGIVWHTRFVTKATYGRTSINILEIEPGDAFTLTQSAAKSGTETLSNKVSGLSVTIRHMTMAEYVSSIEQINGKYDVVYIGNNTSNNARYTSPFSSSAMPTYLPYGREVYNGLTQTVTTYDWRGKVTYQTKNILGMRNNTAWNGVSGVSKGSDGNTYVEYFSENDITNKRATEIKQNIDSGQLVYIDNSIFNSNGTLTGTKLYSNFNSCPSTNLIKFDSTFISDTSKTPIQKVVDKYIQDTTLKAPLLTVTSKPNENNSSRDISFQYRIDTNSDESGMKVNLYLDLNGDGLFKDKELVKSIDNINTVSKSFTGDMNYTIDSQFVGKVTWKLEVVTSGQLKTYTLGNLTYSSNATNKPTVKVLQVYPDSGNNLDLTPSNNSNFSDLINNVTDYNLVISTKSASQFESYLANSNNTLNGNYNMIILGFADNYGHVDFKNDTTYQKLVDFIKTGQSVMFTHDTLTYRYLSPIDTSDLNSKTITYRFRDIIGQARYKDPHNPTEDIYARIDNPPSSTTRGKIIHDQLNASDTAANKISLGLTEGILKQYNGTDPNAGSYVSGTESTSVHKINDGLINKYPFDLTVDENNNVKTDLSVAKTHYQWYQLNLEDPDVVPWYTLNPNNNSGYNKYDARNYYYTYSKGNITYSGTGHTNGYTSDEYKLFINTMVKAERGANHAPTINTDLGNTSVISRNQDKFTFHFTPIDRDNDIIDATVTIKNNGNIVRTFPYSNLKSGDQVTVDILKSDGYNAASLSNIQVIIDAKDPQGAQATPVSNTINLSDGPSISLSASYDKTGYLVGDTANVTVKAQANRATDNIVTTFSNINYSIRGHYNADDVTVDNEVLSFNNIAFKPEVDSSTSPQTKQYSIQIKTDGTKSIPGDLTYKDGNNATPTTTHPMTISLPVREGKAIITVHDKNGQAVSNSGKVDIKRGATTISTVDVNGSYTLNGLTSDTYTFTLSNLPTGYVLSGTSSSINKTFSYDTSTQNIDFTVEPEPVIAELSHGLYYDGVVHEGDTTLTKGTNATFGVNFKISQTTAVVKVDLDNELDGITTDTFKVFKVVNGQLQPVSANITLSGDKSNVANISLSDIDSNSNYVVLYTIKIGTNSSYTNTATLNNITKSVNISCEDLKDLF
ncbi:DUF5057 domain-containing protein [Clostridium sp. C8-1-8]|uniref:DUF5057 domain-containing protein n=1 Tax=Clostridium sp. C8-1-8 TaxID=2698831 RepID=UPI001370D1F0|nr:DUF5057 domain-containing protein [Clostridium sp. C8-1-8]